MKILFKNIADYTQILGLKRHSVDVFVINCSKILCFNSVAGIPGSFRAAEELGEDTGADILLHGRLDIEGDPFLSTLVLKSGALIGVGDCIVHSAYTQGRALRLFEIGKVKSGVVVDRDIFYAGVDNCFNAGAKIVFHNTLEKFDKNHFRAYAAHMRLTNGVYCGLFSDCALVGNRFLRLVNDGEIYDLQPDTEIRADRNFLRISDGR